MTPLAERDAAVFLAQRGSTPVGRALVRAEGCWIEDDEGRRVLDFHGNTCHNLGHAHPAVVAAVHAQLDTLCFVPRRFTAEPAVALAERLAGLWPHGPAKVLFGLSGSDAIEMALKLAWAATGRRRTLGFAGAWHGAGIGALWAGGRDRCRRGFPVLEGCRNLPAPWAVGAAETEAAARASLAALRAALAEGDVACLIAEPLDAAHLVPPDWFWPEAAAALRAAGALLIFDEVPGGLGRTGRMFAGDRFDVAPDMTVLGKSLGGGVVPLSALIARADLDRAAEWEIGHYTHQKSPLLAAAGLAVLEVIKAEGLAARAETMGQALARELAARCPGLRRVHRCGLLVSAGLDEGADPAAIVARAYRGGLNLTAGPGPFLDLRPPLIVGTDEIAAAAEALAGALAG